MRKDKLLAELHQLATLKQVLNGSLPQTPRAEFVDVVVQDKYHLEVIVHVRGGV